MSFYLQIDTEDPQELASNSGWGDVIRWVGTLPPGDATALHHLTQYGWEDDVPGVAAQLSAALKSHPPSKDDVKSTLDNLSDLLKKAGEQSHVVSVTNGLGPDDEGGETE